MVTHPLILRYERTLVLAGYVVLYLLLAVRPLIWMQQYMPEAVRFSTESMEMGVATKPFVTRILVPQTAHVIDMLLPQSAQAPLASLAKCIAQDYRHLAKMPGRNLAADSDHFLCLRLIVGTIMLGSMLAYGMALWRLGEWFFPASLAARTIAPLIGYLIIPIGNWGTVFMYDPTTLCLSAWCFYLMLSQRWRPFLCLFVLACLNKNTAFYITLAYAVCSYDRLDRQRFISMLWVQLIAYTVITAGIVVLFADNAGGMTEHYLFQIFSSWAMPVPFNRVAAWFAGLFLIFYCWPEKPELLRRSGWVVVIAIGIWLFCGQVDELRALYDIFPIITLLLTHSLLRASAIEETWLFKRLANDKYV